MPAEALAFDDEGTIGPVQRALILKSFPGFASLPPSELALLVSITKERFFEKGAVLLRAGEQVNAFYLIVEGMVEALIDGKFSDSFGPRAVVGGLASLAEAPQASNCIATDDTLTLEIATEDMQDVFEDSFHLQMGVLAALARGLRMMQQALGGPAMDSAQQFEPLDFEGDLGLVERLFFMRKTTNWGGTRIEALASLARSAQVEHYRDGVSVFTAGEAAHCGYLVLCGALHCTPHESTVTEPFRFPTGWVVGGLDSLSQDDRWYDAVAVGKTALLRFERTDLLDMLEDHPAEAMSLLRTLAGGMLMAIHRLASHKSELTAPAAPNP